MLSKEIYCIALLLVVVENQHPRVWRKSGEAQGDKESKVFEVECKVSTVLCGHAKFLLQQDKPSPDDIGIGYGPHLATLHRISGRK